MEGHSTNKGGPRDVLSKAWTDISRLDVKDLAKRAGAECNDVDTVVIEFMGRNYVIDKIAHKVQRYEGRKDVNPFIAALILHYLMGAKDINETGRLLTFRELEGGDIYYQAFYRRAIKPIAEQIGPTPELLFERAKRIKGTRMNLGDASVRVPVFSRVNIVVVVWSGDQEVPSSANILFDSSAGYHLHTEDLAAVGDLVADALVLSDEDWRGW